MRMSNENSATKILDEDHWKNNGKAKRFGLLSSAFLQLLVYISKSNI